MTLYLFRAKDSSSDAGFANILVSASGRRHATNLVCAHLAKMDRQDLIDVFEYKNSIEVDEDDVIYSEVEVGVKHKINPNTIIRQTSGYINQFGRRVGNSCHEIDLKGRDWDKINRWLKPEDKVNDEELLDKLNAIEETPEVKEQMELRKAKIRTEPAFREMQTAIKSVRFWEQMGNPVKPDHIVTEQEAQETFEKFNQAYASIPRRSAQIQVTEREPQTFDEMNERNYEHLDAESIDDLAPLVMADEPFRSDQVVAEKPEGVGNACHEMVIVPSQPRVPTTEAEHQAQKERLHKSQGLPGESVDDCVKRIIRENPCIEIGDSFKNMHIQQAAILLRQYGRPGETLDSMFERLVKFVETN